MIKVVCFKWNHVSGEKLPSLGVVGQYTADYVNALYRAVEKNLTIPHEFVCVTDDPAGVECRTIPMWDIYRRLGMCYTRLFVFSEQIKHILGERFVCIDLDVVVTGNLDGLFEREEEFAMAEYPHKDFREQYYNGSCILMEAGKRKQVWERFDPITSPEIIRQKTKRKELIGSDQAWISYVLGKGEKTLGKQEGLYKINQLPNINNPKEACLVTFPGKRDSSKMLHLSWIKEYWNGYL